MKAQHYRPSISNGQITQRRARPVAAAVRPARRKNNSSNKQDKPGGVRGSRILGVMLLLGVLLTGGFLLGIHSQINTLHLNQAEEGLKTDLDRVANEQKFFDLEQRRVLSLSNSERAGQSDGLRPIDLDRRSQSYRVVPAIHTRPATAASDIDEERGATAKVTARPKVAEPKAGRASALKAAKSSLPTAKLAVKATTKLVAGQSVKAANPSKLAAKTTIKPAPAKSGKAAAAPQSKPASKAAAKPVVAKLAKADASKLAQAKRAR